MLNGSVQRHYTVNVSLSDDAVSHNQATRALRVSSVYGLQSDCCTTRSGSGSMRMRYVCDDMKLGC